MAIGWIRAWSEEYRRLYGGDLREPGSRARFRRDFRTALRDRGDESGTELRTLGWADVVELPDGISDEEFTAVRVGNLAGFVLTEHLVELAWIGRDENARNPCVATLTQRDGDKHELLWGDLVQIRRRGAEHCWVRARGLSGRVSVDRLTSSPLLEVYFIDVGQGDGVLLRTPDGRHMLIDGGLPRSNQLTGKNAADFVDWKFFDEYGHFSITLDAIVASHCDYDHYGGLWDLVRKAPDKDSELDCLDVRVSSFLHAGLSRWVPPDSNEPGEGSLPHKDKLGPNDGEYFVRLLEDREDAEAALVSGAVEELQGYWKRFVSDIIERFPEIEICRLGVDAEALGRSSELPTVWADAGGPTIRVLAPVTVTRNGRPALKDLGDTAKNTNGHSVCLRVDHGKARILLTGDLNKVSMDWLLEQYEDCMGVFTSDVGKACHHGSGDISYRFLEQVRAGATVISSGDAEGYAHPRPEIVAASAVTGHLEIDRENDRLVTPLVYMTEIERSASLGEVTHIRYSRLPVDDRQQADGCLLGRDWDQIPERALPTYHDNRRIERETERERRAQLREQAIERETALLEPLADAQAEIGTSAEYHYRTVRGLFNIEYGTRPVQGSRLMIRNHYGLVNVRTDGETILCATRRESGEGWTVHTFKARF